MTLQMLGPAGPVGFQQEWPSASGTARSVLGLVPTPSSLTTLAQTKFVAKNGSDATGDGSIAAPFLTIQAAISSITDASAAKPYAVVVMPGVWTEVFLVAPFVYVEGISPVACFLGPTQANWISAAFATGTQDSGIAGFTLTATLTVDFSLVASTGAGTFKLANCVLGSAVALVFKGNNSANVVQLQNLLSIGPTSSPLTLTNITCNAGAVNLRNGTLTISGTDAYTCSHRFESLATGGAINCTWTGAVTANNLNVTFYTGEPPVNPTTLTISGAAAAVYTRGVQQKNGPDANTTFSFGNIPNAGTVVFPQGADIAIVANPTAPRTYTLEGGGASGTRLRVVNQSAFAITLAYSGGAAGPAVVVAALTTANLYASSQTQWN